MRREKMERIVLDVNGRTHEVDVEKNWTLLYVLRDRMDITGPKPGCNTGDCGACKVLIDGEPVNSCTTMAVKCVGKKVVTIEGIAKDGKLSPVQESFVEKGAVQCGYCTPGMVITSTALLNKNQNPTREEVREALKNNLCRCTGYVKIVDAVMDAAEKIRSERGE